MQNQVKIVGTFQYENGKFVPIDTNRRDFKKGKAVRVPYDQVQKYYPIKLQSVVHVGEFSIILP